MTSAYLNQSLGYQLALLGDPAGARAAYENARDEFESDASQKLGIDLARFKEMRKPARKRRDEVRPTGLDALNEAERVLLRAAASSPR